MAFCAERQLDNLEVSAVGFDVEIDELTDDIAALGVQGPTSASILKAMGFEGIEMLKPFDIKHYPYQGEEISISRTGFTGDLGYEVLMPNSVALSFYNEMFDKGRIYNIRPAGLEALDLLRIEAGLCNPVSILWLQKKQSDLEPPDHLLSSDYHGSWISISQFLMARLPWLKKRKEARDIHL